MKKIFALLLLAGIGIGAMAQEVRSPHGYQGMLEQSNSICFGKVDNEPLTLTGIGTTHGFYMGPRTYIGVGFNVLFCSDFAVAPVYTSVTYLFNETKLCSPIVGFRMGSAFGHSTGPYGEAGLGLRFASKRDFAVSVWLTASYLKSFDITDRGYDYHTDTTPTHYNPSNVSLKFAIEW